MNIIAGKIRKFEKQEKIEYNIDDHQKKSPKTKGNEKSYHFYD